MVKNVQGHIIVTVQLRTNATPYALKDVQKYVVLRIRQRYNHLVYAQPHAKLTKVHASGCEAALKILPHEGRATLSRMTMRDDYETQGPACLHHNVVALGTVLTFVLGFPFRNRLRTVGSTDLVFAKSLPKDTQVDQANFAFFKVREESGPVLISAKAYRALRAQNIRMRPSQQTMSTDPMTTQSGSL